MYYHQLTILTIKQVHNIKVGIKHIIKTHKFYYLNLSNILIPKKFVLKFFLEIINYNPI